MGLMGWEMACRPYLLISCKPYVGWTGTVIFLIMYSMRCKYTNALFVPVGQMGSTGAHHGYIIPLLILYSDLLPTS